MPNGRLNGWWPKIIAALIGVVGTAVLTFGVAAINDRANVLEQVRDTKEKTGLNTIFIADQAETSKKMLIELTSIREALVKLETTMGLKIQEAEKIHGDHDRRIDRLEARRP